MSLESVEIEIDQEVYLECYHHLLDTDDIDIELIWGGRDSGKSHFVAQLAVEECLSKSYYRCVLVKETHEAIKDSQIAMIEEIVEDWGVDQLFKIIKSPLEIRGPNKNGFIARGTDKPKKLRSITNPSHVWGEEGNQISELAFITLLTSLRNKHGKVKFILTFNPEADCPDFNDHWIFKMFFANHYPQTLSFTSEISIEIPNSEPVKLRYRSTHTTYKDNPHVSPQRIAFHEALKAMNYHWYHVFTLGLWGNQENDCPWLFAFDETKQISPVRLYPKKSEVLYLSFDFNRNPQVCTVIQHYDETIWIIDVIKKANVGTEGICEIIALKYPGYVIIVTGDYSGDTVSSLHKEHVTNYTIIKTKLNLSDAAIQITVNPPLKSNQTLVNSVFFSYNVQICPVNAQPFIYDAKNVKKRADGTIVKDNRNDPSQQADVLDTVRYWINKFMAWFTRNINPYVGAQKNNLPAITNNIFVKDIGQAKAKIESALPLITDAEGYANIRNELLEQAGKWIANGETAKATFAISEVKRLDLVFNV